MIEEKSKSATPSQEQTAENSGSALCNDAFASVWLESLMFGDIDDVGTALTNLSLLEDLDVRLLDQPVIKNIVARASEANPHQIPAITLIEKLSSTESGRRLVLNSFPIVV